MFSLRFCIRQIIILLILLVISGCAASNSYSRIRYSPNFIKVKIDQIAIMPFSNKYLKEEEKEEIDDILNKSISSLGIFKYSVTPSNATDSVLKENNLIIRSENFWEDFLKNGLVDKDFLGDVNSTLNSKYLLKGEILRRHTQDNVYRKIIGYTEVDVKFVLFSTVSKDVVWEVNITGKKNSPNTIFYPLPSTMDAVEIALDRFIHEFPLYVL